MEKPHKKLNVWNKSIEFVLYIYKIIRKFPKDEEYVLIPQIKRSAISIPANIAEGAGRSTRKEFINFLHIAQASLSELDTHLEISRRLNYLSAEDYDSLNSIMIEIDQMISGLINFQKNKL